MPNIDIGIDNDSGEVSGLTPLNGIKDYFKKVNSQLGYLKITASLLKDDTEFFINIPVCSFLEDDTLGLSIVSNPFKTHNYGFGNGTLLSHQRLFSLSGDNYKLTLPDYSAVILNKKSTTLYESSDCNYKLTVESDGYRLYDKKGNYYSFDSISDNMPTKLTLVNGDILRFNQNQVYINGSTKDFLQYTNINQSNITYSYYRSESTLYRKVVLTYQNSYISQITYYGLNNQLIGNYTIERGSNYLLIKDTLNKTLIKFNYILNSDKRILSSIVTNTHKTFSQDSDKTTTYSYQTSSDETIITETLFNGRITKYFLDSTSRHTLTISHEGVVSQVEYDSLNNIKKVIRPHLFKDSQNQILSTQITTAQLGINTTDTKTAFGLFHKITSQSQSVTRSTTEVIKPNSHVAFSFFLRSTGINKIKAKVTNDQTIIKEEDLMVTSNFKLFTVEINEPTTLDKLSIMLYSPEGYATTWDVSPIYGYIKRLSDVYNYDEKYNLIGIENENNSIFKYNENNYLISREDNTSQISQIMYDEYKRVTRVLDSDYNEVSFEYSQDSQSPLHKANKPLSIHKIINGKLFLEKYTYNEVFQVLTHTDSNNNTLTYEYDDNYDLVKITDEYGNEKSITRNSKGQIEKYINRCSDAISQVDLAYEGDLIRRIYSNNLNYYYTYNDDKSLSKVEFGKLQDFRVLNQYSYKTINGKLTDIIDREVINNMGQTYTYDTLNERVDEVNFDSNENPIIYTHDEDDRLVKASNDNSEISFIYDKKNQVIEEQYKITGESIASTNYTTYDHGVIEKVNLDNKNQLVLKETKDKSDSYKHNNFIRKLKYSDYYSCYFNTLDSDIPSSSLANDFKGKVDSYNKAVIAGLIDINKACVNLPGSDYALTYRLPETNESSFNTFLGVTFSVNDIYNNNSKTLLNYVLGENTYLNLKFMYETLVLEVVNNGEVICSIQTDEYKVGINNAVGLNIYVNEEDEIINYDLYLNRKLYHITSENFMTNYSPTSRYVLTVGARSNFQNNFIYYTFMVGSISSVCYGPKATVDFINKYSDTSRLIKDNLNILTQTEGKMDSRVITYGDILNAYSSSNAIQKDFYPLNGSFESVDGNKPKKVKEESLESASLAFKYRNDLDRYLYNLNSKVLEFEVGSNSLSIIVKVNLEKAGSILNISNDLIVYVDEDNKLMLKMNASTYETGINFNLNQDNTISLRYMKKSEVNSYGTEESSVVIRVNDEVYTLLSTYNYPLQLDKLYLGEGYSNIKDSEGTVEMLYITDEFLSDENLNSILSKYEVFTKERRYHKDGRLLQEEIKWDNELVNKKVYIYQNYTTEEGVYDTNVVYSTSDLIKLAPSFYTFDKRGNILTDHSYSTGEAPNEIEVHKSLSYEYDYHNRLIRRTNNLTNQKYEYYYNEYGALTRIDYTPGLDEQIKTTTFIISNNAPFNTVSSYIKNNITYNLSYLNNKLSNITYYENGVQKNKTFTYNEYGLSGYSDGEINVTYDYDFSGRRVKKTIGNKKYCYYYSGDKLVTEFIDDIRIDYLYDESDMLFGFMYNDEIYFYDRDILGQINGIYCKDRTKVVEYTYSPYGEVLSITGSGASTLGVLNHMLYKGYYYDEETNLALLSSRYYSPELGRFIQPADVSSLNPHSINGLNLYAYANNNPIGLAYSSSVVGFGDSSAMVSLLSLGGLSSYGNNLPYSNSLNIFAGLSMPQLFSKKSLCDLAKDFSVNIGEVLGRVIWGLTKNGHAFSDFHYAADGINGYTLFDNLPSTSGKIFKGLGIALMINDVFEAGYNSYQNGHSFGQGALNVGLTAGKNYLIYKASIGITTVVGTWAGAKLGASLGSFAGPVGLVIGAIAGTVVGWLIDEFGDAIIDWVVGWFD